MKNVSFFDFALREKKKKRKENWNLTKIIKKNAKNVDGNYLLWNNISMGKNIGMLFRSGKNEGGNICLVSEGKWEKLAL